jgi:glutaconate CoA-transferase subunit A
MTEKIMTARQAVARFVNNSDQIALGGFTVTRNPMHIIREIIRQKKESLYLVVHSHGQGMELLIGAGEKFPGTSSR